MSKIIYNKFDKHNIQELPRAVFGGRIIVINTTAEAEKACCLFAVTKNSWDRHRDEAFFQEGSFTRCGVIASINTRHMFSFPPEPYRDDSGNNKAA